MCYPPWFTVRMRVPLCKSWTMALVILVSHIAIRSRSWSSSAMKIGAMPPDTDSFRVVTIANITGVGASANIYISSRFITGLVILFHLLASRIGVRLTARISLSMFRSTGNIDKPAFPLAAGMAIRHKGVCSG